MRRIRGLELADVVFCPESNYANEGKRIAVQLAQAQIDRVYCLREDTRGNEGIRVTEDLKAEMVVSFNALIMGRHVRFHPYTVSVSSGESKSSEGMRKRLIDEIARYQRQIIPNERDPCALPKIRHTGKIGGATDDLCITIQLLQKAKEFWFAKSAFYNNLRPLWVPT